ncbi:plasma membrane iron permease 1, partial [Aspergillus lentulus]
KTAVNVFSVPVLVVVFRETVEAVIIISVLLAFLKQTLSDPNNDANKTIYKSLLKQASLKRTDLSPFWALGLGWHGSGLSALPSHRWCCNWHLLHSRQESGNRRIFYLVAAIIIAVIGAALLRIGEMQDKWRQKVVKAMDNPQKEGRKGYFRRIAGKYALFFLAFITVSCEGIEAVVFVAGVSFSAPATAVPLPVIVGLIAGCIVGWLLYKGGFYAKLQFFLVIATCVMYLVASGIFARSIWYFEQYHWNRMVGKDVGELGAGLGSYDISRSVWHINLMAEVAGGSSTEYLGGRIPQPTAQSYLITSTRFAVPIAFIAMRFHKINGHWRLMRPKTLADSASGESPEWCITGDEVNDVKNGLVEGKVEL